VPYIVVLDRNRDAYLPTHWPASARAESYEEIRRIRAIQHSPPLPLVRAAYRAFYRARTALIDPARPTADRAPGKIYLLINRPDHGEEAQ